MKIGVIGLGSIGERHVRNMQDMYPRADIDILTKRKNWSDASKRTQLVSSERTFFKTKHDIYFITNETHKHATTILKCLEQKPRGIFVEKPISHTSKGLSHIAAKVKKQRVVFLVGYCLQFFKPLVMLKTLLDKRVIGRVLALRASAGKDVKTWRKTDYRGRYSSDKKKGGGAILDLIHELNYPAWLLNEPLQFVSGFSGHISDLDITSEDIAEGIFVSEKKGIPVSVHVDYLQVPGRRSCEVIGTKGTLSWSRILLRDSIKNELRIDRQESSRVIRVQAGGNDMYRKELRSFMGHVRAGDGYNNLAESIRDVQNADALKRRGAHLGK